VAEFGHFQPKNRFRGREPNPNLRVGELVAEFPNGPGDDGVERRATADGVGRFGFRDGGV
jgi:hypothetical protein